MNFTQYKQTNKQAMLEIEIETYEDEDEDEDDSWTYKTQWSKKKRKYQHALKNEGEIVYYRSNAFMDLSTGEDTPKAKIRLLTDKGEVIKAKSFAYAVYKSSEKYFKSMYPEFKPFTPSPDWVAYSAQCYHTNQMVNDKRKETAAIKGLVPLKCYLEAGSRTNYFSGDYQYTGDVYFKFDVGHEVIFTEQFNIASVVSESIYYEVKRASLEGEAPAVPLQLKPRYSWTEGDYITGFSSHEEIVNWLAKS